MLNHFLPESAYLSGVRLTIHHTVERSTAAASTRSDSSAWMTLAWLSICSTSACGSTSCTDCSASTFCRIETLVPLPPASSASNFSLALPGLVSRAMPST